MKSKKLLLVSILLALSLSCNFVTQAILPATPTRPSSPTALPTFTLAPALSETPASSDTPAPPIAGEVYTPPGCEGSALATLPAATAQALPTAGLAPDKTITTAQQLALFDKVVAQINKVYLYPDFNGVDWKGIVASYRAKVKAGMDTPTFYDQMSSLMAELKDNHSQFFSPVVAAATDAEMAGHTDYVGIGVLVNTEMEKKRIVILAVFPDSPAEHAGLKAHDSLLATDGQPLVDDTHSYIWRVRGPECSAVVLTVQSPGEAVRQVTIRRHRITSPSPIDARLVTTSDGSRIGYIFMPSFEDTTLIARVAQALQDFGNLDGLIIDNRMNPGGSSSVVEPILGYFTDGVLGNFIGHDGSRPFRVSANEINNSQSVPMVVLVGKDTASFGEIFSGILQDIGRAKVVGQTSSGIVELLHVYEFDDGSRIWIAEERFEPRVSHANWEKVGIKPDVQAFADWDTFIFDNDPAIVAALKIFGHK